MPLVARCLRNRYTTLAAFISLLVLCGGLVASGSIRVILAPSEGKRRKTLTVTLRTPNTTTLPNKTETDRQFVFNLLERWRLIAPPPEDEEVVEAA